MFCCVLSLDGQPVSPDVRCRYSARVRGLAEGDSVEEVDAGAFMAWVVPARVPLRPLWAKRGRRVAVGNVRLDHPEEVRLWGRMGKPCASSLELVLDAYELRGERCLTEMLGDFSLVIYDAPVGRLVAARDALGVKSLYRAERRNVLIVSSHLELIHDAESLDEEFVADFLLGGNPDPRRTIWGDTEAVPQGAILSVRGTDRSFERFWTAYTFTPVAPSAGDEPVRVFQALFREAVRVRLEGDGSTWAELSGGLDSSSVVSMAERLRAEGQVKHGLAATLSVVDELGDGDERRYSDLVARGFGVRNVPVSNLWPWCEDDEEPPRTDEPRSHYPFFARDRLNAATVRRGGGRALLTGWGSDHFLYGSGLFMSDALARGRLGLGLRLIAHLAVVERQSFWQILMRDALLPLAPVGIRRCFAPSWDRIPPWIRPAFVRRTNLRDRLWFSRVTQARRGHRFWEHNASAVDELPRWLPRGVYEDGLELRHPFLYRPLVEHCLRLPPEMLVNRGVHKWILREAMRGILPEAVRCRPGKGGIDARVLWALNHERSRLDRIVGAPLLEASGIVDGNALRHALQVARTGTAQNMVMLLCVLGLETWLHVREGRWIQHRVREPLPTH